ncbi:PDZ domain-containing protein [Leptospira yasudae]|uniref:PDZ domain-containing protein n=1 Tax=Leptospira yasudae TaxID=2202201 RepID=UPI0014386040|nr:PDZ domain-containing protein [Leptospira yasudae]
MIQLRTLLFSLVLFGFVSIPFPIFAEVSPRGESDLLLIKKNHVKAKHSKNATAQNGAANGSAKETQKEEKKESVSKSSKSAQESYYKSIVQIKVTYQEPEYHQPWKKKNPRVRRGVGVVTEGNRILIPYSLLPDATLVEVKKYSSYSEMKAIVFRQDPESNLALLRVEKQNFFDDLVPLGFSPVVVFPKQVNVYQLDNSGSIQSTAAALLSMDMDQMPLGQVELPVVDLSSSEGLNGFGEVVIENGKVTGLLYDFTSGKNSGRIIPSFIIQKFVHTPGTNVFGYKGFRFRPITDGAVKKYYGMEEGDSGILVADVIPGSSASGVLKLEDVILEFGGKNVDSKGYIDHPLYGKQVLSFLAHSGDSFGYSLGKEIPMLVLRDKKKIQLSMKLKPFPYSAVRIPYKSIPNSNDYAVEGGFVFLELSEALLEEWGKDWRSRVDRKLLYLYDYSKFHEKEGDTGRIVLLSQVLPDESNDGFHDFSFKIVEKIDGQDVKSVADLKRNIREGKSNYAVISLDDGNQIALDRTKLGEINERIYKSYKIRFSGN